MLPSSAYVAHDARDTTNNTRNTTDGSTSIDTQCSEMDMPGLLLLLLRRQANSWQQQMTHR